LITGRCPKATDSHSTAPANKTIVRADESKHREVNHTFGNLDQKEDPNPFVSEYRDTEKPHPGKGLAYPKPTGWERHEII
jgi:ubiquinol oxidase